MAYKQSPFPLIDGTKKTKEAVSKVLRTINPLGAKLSKNLDIKGYLKGEQGYIPDWKGESTKETVHKVAKKVAKRTAPKKQKKTKKNLDHLKVVPENRGINRTKPEPVGDKLVKETFDEAPRLCPPQILKDMPRLELQVIYEI